MLTVLTLSSPESGFAQADSGMCLTGGAVEAGAGQVALKAPRSLWTLLCTAQTCRKTTTILKPFSIKTVTYYISLGSQIYFYESLTSVEICGNFMYACKLD